MDGPIWASRRGTPQESNPGVRGPRWRGEGSDKQCEGRAVSVGAEWSGGEQMPLEPLRGPLQRGGGMKKLEIQ